MKDFIIILALSLLAIGVYILFTRSGGGGGGATVSTSPSSLFPGGGYQPGFVATQVRNGGVGASSPNVQFN